MQGIEETVPYNQCRFIPYYYRIGDGGRKIMLTSFFFFVHWTYEDVHRVSKINKRGRQKDVINGKRDALLGHQVDFRGMN